MFTSSLTPLTGNASRAVCSNEPGGRHMTRGMRRLCAWSSQLCAVLLLLAGMWSAATAQTFTSLASFNQANGANPEAQLVQGLDGNLYGITPLGGKNLNGALFKITPTGT